MSSQKGTQRFRAAVTLSLETQPFLPWKNTLFYLLTKHINTEGATLQWKHIMGRFAFLD